MSYLSDKETLNPVVPDNWEILPRQWVENARENDLKYFN
jgi:hypothetical protein